jgi:hypothetical protein
VIREYIKDDAASPGRTADHQYAWTKNGALSQMITPSTAVVGWTFGSAGSNSDTDRVTATWRTSTSTPIADAILYEPYGPLHQYNQQNKTSALLLRTVITHNLAYRSSKLETEVRRQRPPPMFTTLCRATFSECLTDS